MNSTVNEVYFPDEVNGFVKKRRSSLSDPKQASSSLGPEREYPFLESSDLTADMDIQGLVTYDTVDKDGFAVELKLDPFLLEVMMKKTNEALEAKAVSPKFNRESYINGRVDTISRMLRPELVKEEAGVMAAAELLTDRYKRDQTRRAYTRDISITQLKREERYDMTPAMELARDFKEWAAPQWEEARKEAVEVMLEHVDPRFTYEVALATGFITQEEMVEVERVQKRVTERSRRQLGRVAALGM